MPIPLLLHGKHAPPLSAPAGQAGPTVRYEPFGPWLVPWRFTSLEEEYAALRTGVGLIDYSGQAVIEAAGTDRAGFLHNLLTNDINRLAQGRGCRAALLTANGKLVSDLLVLADAEAHWLVCDLERAPSVVETLSRYIFSEQVSLVNHERRWAVLALEGPRASELRASRPELPAWRIPHALTGRPGALCLVEAAGAEAAWKELQQRGGPFGLRLIGWEALQAARIEAGIPWFGVDMDETNLLPETGLERIAVSDTKGCYLGQEIVARLATYGSASKKLMGLLLDGEDLPEAGDEIARDGEEVGRVTSACRSPALKRPIALGYLKRGAYEAGTRVEILHAGGHLPATVAELPLVK